jgi:4-hydroxymandelate oxidase
MTNVLTNCLNLNELEEEAQKLLPKMPFDYFAGGANDEITLRANKNAWQKKSLLYKVLVDVSKRDLSTTVLGQKIPMPLLIAPTAFHRLAHPEGEIATIKAASQAGIIMTLSSLSNTTIEDVAAHANGNLWFQLYVYKDRGLMRSMVERAEESGCKAIMVTVDAPFIGQRARDARNHFHLPEGLNAQILMSSGIGTISKNSSGSGLSTFITDNMDQSLTWLDIEKLAASTTLPILVKGVVRADDAKRATEYGARGVVVSNHGGRQLDTAPATFDVLPAIAEAVFGKTEILIDGGIRRGTDIIKAIAYGATAVMVGRPIIWGLAVNGQQGVRQVLDTLKSELDLAMALCGCPTIKDISHDLLGEMHV